MRANGMFSTHRPSLPYLGTLGRRFFGEEKVVTLVTLWQSK